MILPSLHKLVWIALLAAAFFVLCGCDAYQTGNPERMQKSLDQQKKAMGSPPPMPKGPGMPTQGTPGSTNGGGAGGAQ